MSITVGRLTLPGPKRPNITPQGLSFSGLITGLSQADTNARQRQIVGLKGDLVPVIWTPGEITGFYRVADASCDVHFLTATRSAMDFALQLEFVGHQPDFESLLIGAQVPNVHGVTGTPWAGQPASNFDTPTAEAATVTRTTADGTIDVATYATAPSTARWFVTPASWYASAVTVSVASHAQTGVDTNATPAQVVLSNGLVRVTADAASQLNFEFYSAGAWRSRPYTVYLDGVAQSTGWSAVQVIRNSPQVCTVRYLLDRTYVDVTLRRGAVFATVSLSRRSADKTLGLGRSTAEAATAITAGQYSTATTESLRTLMSSPEAFTSDLVQGSLVSAAAQQRFVVNVGYEIGGSGSSGLNTAAAVVAQSMWHTDERVRAVRL